MNLNEGFIELKYLTMRIESLWIMMKKYNSIIIGKVRPYEIRELYSEIIMLQNKKLELRKKIAVAMAPVRPYILEKKEIKIQMRNLNTIRCNEGRHQTVFDRTVREMNAEFKDNEIEKMKSMLEDQLKKCEITIAELYASIKIE